MYFLDVAYFVLFSCVVFHALLYMCALSCSSRPAIVLYCFVGRETLCCLCLNKLLCICICLVAMIQGMNMKVIKAMTIMHEIKEINIFYTQSVLADCLKIFFIPNQC